MDVVTARLITQLPDENSYKPRRRDSKPATQGKYSKVTSDGSGSSKTSSIIKKSTKSTATSHKSHTSSSNGSNRKDILDSSSSAVVVAKSTNKSTKYKGLVDCIVRMWTEEGAQAFFTGAVARVAWIAPFTAISLGINERLKRQLLLWKPMVTVMPRRSYFFRKFY